MSYKPSILFDTDLLHSVHLSERSPDCFADLRLDQIVDSITAGREEFELKPFFYHPLSGKSAVQYRFRVFEDLENKNLLAAIRSFCRQMKRMRKCREHSKKSFYRQQQHFWFLEAVAVYCGAVREFSQVLSRATLHSKGMQKMRTHLSAYVHSPHFQELAADARYLKHAFSRIRYSFRIFGNRIIVGSVVAGSDYQKSVLRTFARFRESYDIWHNFSHRVPKSDLNHVDAAILERVALLFPELFANLEKFCGHGGDYLDPAIASFTREIQFYIACIEEIEYLESTGLRFCIPDLSTTKQTRAHGAFDFALAERSFVERETIVTNDFMLQGNERIIVISGPNQGGKTTFARSFGQIHYLTSIGCPVPAARAELFLCDRVFTHFAREESGYQLRGRLEDELERMRTILSEAKPDSIIIMNESFISTALEDALYLNKKIIDSIYTLDAICLAVTFLDELASYTNATVSMIAQLDRHSSGGRTFKVLRSRVDGLASANVIAERHSLTYRSIESRILANVKRKDQA